MAFWPVLFIDGVLKSAYGMFMTPRTGTVFAMECSIMCAMVLEDFMPGQ